MRALLAVVLLAVAVGCGPSFNDRAYGLASTDRVERVLYWLGERGYRLGRE